ncbi:MAG: HEAT repeat domain-containing protein [Candidatus Omnitrophica bacterium]|nr:HEAT repeat domain-containing protein [Candidatus Omnitrophota bacterium]
MKKVNGFLVFITIILLIFPSKVSFSVTEEQIKTYAPKCIEVLKSETTSAEEKKEAATKLRYYVDKSITKQLIELLKAKDPMSRYTAVRYLDLTKDPLAIPALVDTLKDKDDGVRRLAASALQGYSGKEENAPAFNSKMILRITQSLHDQDAKVRRSVLLILASLKDQSAVPSAVKALGDPEPEVRKEAVNILIKLDVYKAAPYLMRVLKDKNEDVQRAAICGLICSKNTSIVPNLIDLTKDQDANIRRQAIFCLQFLNDKRAIPVFIKSLDDQDKEVRRRAVYALGAKGFEGTEVIDGLIKALGDESDEVREAAAFGLGHKEGAKKAIPVLMDAYKKGSNRSRISSSSTLIKLCDKTDIPFFVGLLKSDNPHLKSQTCYILENIGDKSAIAPLLEVYKKDADENVKLSAFHALITIDDFPEMRPICLEALKMSKPQFKCYALYGLMKLKDESVYDDVIKYSKDENREVRKAAIVFIGSSTNKNALKDIEPFLEDADLDVREETVVLIVKKLGKESIPILERHVDRTSDSSDPVKVTLNALKAGKEPDAAIIEMFYTFHE